MNLSKKTFVYSSIIATIVVLLMVGYFVFMFPSLYVDYMKKVNYQSIKDIQEKFIKEGSYKNISSRNPTQNMTLKIPKEGSIIYFYNSVVSLEIDIKDENVLKTINEGRQILKDYSGTETFEDDDFNFLENILYAIRDSINLQNFPYDIKSIEKKDYAKYELLSNKITAPSNDTIIYQANVTDSTNYYTTYLAMSNVKDDLIVTVLPVMTPQLSEMSPIIFQSLPMIIVIAILLIIIATFIFSRKIVKPIEKLASHARYIEDNYNLDIVPVEITEKDEIAELGEVLNDLYSKLNKSFKELEEKNTSLEELNKRQEVFLRASSHQLKTPIAATLLLLDSMINEIGKFKNSKEYLPKVKEQVLSMKSIVDSILNLNKCTLELNVEKVNVNEIIESILTSHQLALSEKNIRIKNENKELDIESDGELLYKILDNLISNAINYTEKGEEIKIHFENEAIKIINYGAHIDEDLLPHIFEPFVSSSSENRGHGLGLYIVAYYCKVLEIKIKINNIEDGVETIIMKKL